jgi:hypothetical protein
MRVKLIGAAVITAAFAWGGVSEAQIPTQDSVTGTAAIGFGRSFVEFEFDVHSGPAGENPAGTVHLEGPLIVGGPLQIGCLDVKANRASMFLPAPSPGVPLAGLVIFVEDNGPTGDRVEWQPIAGPAPSGCPAPTGLLGPPVNSGDVTVVDARSTPTAKEQCKNGGWQSFGVFKNQGDCVSYVAATGKSQPAGSKKP